MDLQQFLESACSERNLRARVEFVCRGSTRSESLSYPTLLVIRDALAERGGVFESDVAALDEELRLLEDRPKDHKKSSRAGGAGPGTSLGAYGLIPIPAPWGAIGRDPLLELWMLKAWGGAVASHT